MEMIDNKSIIISFLTIILAYLYKNNKFVELKVNEMIQKAITIEYLECSSIEEFSSADRELIEKAVEAARNAYAPYSKFCVGAAIRMSGGEIVAASNQENSAYPSGLCAERVTAFYANAKYPDQYFDTLVITAMVDGVQCEVPTNPCGACRQVLMDYELKGGHQLRVILAGSKLLRVYPSIRALLPFSFDNLPEQK